MQQELSETRTGINRGEYATQQGRNYKGTVPATESLPNQHHLTSHTHMDAAKEQIEESTKKDCCRFGFIIQIIISLFRMKHIEPHHIREESEDYYSCVKNRSLPVSTLIDILKMKTGKDDIHEGNIMSTLYDIFGEDASPTVKNIVKFGRDSSPQGGDESEGHVGSLGMVSKQETYPRLTRNYITDCGIPLSVRQTDQEAADVSRSAGD